MKRRKFLATMAVSGLTTYFPRIQSVSSQTLNIGGSDLTTKQVSKNMVNSVNSYKFPDNFLWGVATSAYQIEGAVSEGGRKPSVWDTFSAKPGKIKNNDTGAVANDHYHLYKSDVQLMAALGIKHYRFSIAWPRIIPDGRGQVNEAGIDFYKRLVDTLREYGITPHATLYHWDTPQALDNLYGSWRSREIAKDFADYATAVVSRLGDRITDWMTLNEIAIFTHLGYGVNTEGVFAPGTRLKTAKELWQTSHHALLAHGLGCQAIRAATPVKCTVALVDNMSVTVPVGDVGGRSLAIPKATIESLKSTR